MAQNDGRGGGGRKKREKPNILITGTPGTGKTTTSAALAGYTGQKLSNNIECGIFQVLLEEAKESYSEGIVVTLRSHSVDDLEKNLSTLTDWIRSWSSSS